MVSESMYMCVHKYVGVSGCVHTCVEVNACMCAHVCEGQSTSCIIFNYLLPGQRTREDTDPINTVPRRTGPAGWGADGMNRNGLVLEISEPCRLKS